MQIRIQLYTGFGVFVLKNAYNLEKPRKRARVMHWPSSVPGKLADVFWEVSLRPIYQENVSGEVQGTPVGPVTPLSGRQGEAGREARLFPALPCVAHAPT